MNKPKALRQAVEAIDLAVSRLERGEVASDAQAVLRSVRSMLSGHLDLATRQRLADRQAKSSAAIAERQRAISEANRMVRPMAPIVGDARPAKDGHA